MATPAQINANRANALLSTGPRSPEGKAAAARNSFKLGLNAQATIIPGEDPAEFDELAASYLDELQPVGPVEAELVQTIVRSAWMRRRYFRIEAAVINARAGALKGDDAENPLGAIFIQDSATGDTLAKIFRRQQAAQRDWQRAMIDFRSLQSLRCRHEALAAEAPAPILDHEPNWLRSSAPPQPIPHAAPRPAAEPPVNLALRL